MKAVILAAGYATRLYPLTKNFPKSLLKIAGKPLLEYTIEKICSCEGIDTLFIITNSRFVNCFYDWLGAYQKSNHSSMNIEIEILDDHTCSNESRIGSIADLQLVLETKNIVDDVLVLCSDKMFEFTLLDFIEFFKQKHEIVNACFDTGELERIRHKHGCVVVDNNKRIVSFQEKPARPKSSIASIAFYIFPAKSLPRINQYLKEGGNPDAPGNLLSWLVQKDPAYAFLFSEDCYDIGTVESYRQVNSIYMEKWPQN